MTRTSHARAGRRDRPARDTRVIGAETLESRLHLCASDADSLAPMTAAAGSSSTAALELPSDSPINLRGRFMSGTGCECERQ